MRYTFNSWSSYGELHHKNVGINFGKLLPVPFQMNRSLIIYWIIANGFHIILTFCMIVMIFWMSSFYVVEELLNFGMFLSQLRKLFRYLNTFIVVLAAYIFCFIIVWKLYIKIRQRDLANFAVMTEERDENFENSTEVVWTIKFKYTSN